MKTVGIFLLLLFSAFFINAQSEIDKFIYTDISSHLKGNRSYNLSFGIKKKRIFQSIGFDYYYKIYNQERTLDKNDLSFAFNYHISRKMNKSSYFDWNFGLSLKYGNFHLFQLDAAREDLWTRKNWIFKRDIHKITAIPFLELYKTNNNIFYGIQYGIGIAYIFQHEQSLIEQYTDTNTFGISKHLDFIDISPFYEHGYYRNDEAFNRMVAIQCNILIGYKF